MGSGLARRVVHLASYLAVVVVLLVASSAIGALNFAVLFIAYFGVGILVSSLVVSLDMVPLGYVISLLLRVQKRVSVHVLAHTLLGFLAYTLRGFLVATAITVVIAGIGRISWSGQATYLVIFFTAPIMLAVPLGWWLAVRGVIRPARIDEARQRKSLPRL